MPASDVAALAADSNSDRKPAHGTAFCPWRDRVCVCVLGCSACRSLVVVSIHLRCIRIVITNYYSNVVLRMLAARVPRGTRVRRLQPTAHLSP